MRYFVTTIEYDRHVILPLAIGGVVVGPDEAIDAFNAGELNAVGTYPDSEEARRRCEKLNNRGK